MKRFWLAFVVVGAVGVMVAGCGEDGDPDTGANEGFVCGKDGNTYSVEDAARGEHEVAHRGRCDEPMPCESPNDCFVGDDCRPAPSDWCVPGPTRCNCPGVFEPVCGGDHRNYINACEAACAGVGIRHEGYCEEPPGDGCVRAGCSDHLCVEEGIDIASTCEWRPVYQCYQQATCERQQNGQCGFTPTHELVECLERFGEGMCYHDSDCPIGWICQQGILGSPQHEGVCERCGCPEIYAPVCGVDGQTYGNACEARCAHVRVAYEGECKDDCPVETHIRNFNGECVPKCYGPEQCGDEQHCNAPDVCLQDPACPECDVCVGWCVPPAGDCRTNGCEPGWTCDYCQTADGPAWICLSPLAGACLPPDCRSEGCGDGQYCTYCWVSYECIPEGAVC
jgi:hypothetical protein